MIEYREATKKKLSLAVAFLTLAPVLAAGSPAEGPDAPLTAAGVEVEQPAPSNFVAPGNEPVPVGPPNLSPAAEPIKFANVTETVTIEGVRYDVPVPWSGNRLFPTAVPISELQQIPTDFTYERSELYIAARAYEPLLDMLHKASEDGIELRIESAYRSMHYQKRIFQRMIAAGRSFDDIVRYVAPPGYSQHMLGTALDFYPSNWSFAETEQYRWLQENAAAFGFEQTYARFNRLQMPWESWHWNYVGPREPEPAPIMSGAENGDRPQAAR